MSENRSNEIPESRRSALIIAAEGSGESTVAEALRRDGFTVTITRNPYEAYGEFLKNPVKLVVLSLKDLHPRDRSLLRELGRLSPDLRVLLLVPEGGRRDAMEFLQVAGDGLLPTPCYMEEVRCLARSLLRGDAADPLTGLPNREAVRRAFERECARVVRARKSHPDTAPGLGLGLLDLDGFKNVNEEFGYLVADRVLIEGARRLRKAFRITDVVARWGGEEFLVLLSSLPPEEAAATSMAWNALDRARELMSASPMPIEKHHIQTISGGYALFPRDGEYFTELFDKANVRLDRAKKRKKKNCIEPKPPKS